MFFNLFKKTVSAEVKLPKRMWLNEELSKKEIEEYKNVFDQITGEEFINILNDEFTPLIKSFDFRGSKNNFYKRNSPWIYTINIFKDKYGGNCALNVGIHLDFVENQIDQLPIPSKFTIADCMISKSIEMDNGNNWYYYGKDRNEGLETVELMASMFKKKAVPFLQKFENYPSPFDKITLSDLVYPTDKYTEYGISKQMLTGSQFQIFLSKIKYTIGQTELALDILEKARAEVLKRNNNSSSPLVEKINKLLQNYR
jgi:hypothetical protein